MFPLPPFIDPLIRRLENPNQVEKDYFEFQNESNKCECFSENQSATDSKNPLIKQEITSYFYNQHHQAPFFNQKVEAEEIEVHPTKPSNEFNEDQNEFLFQFQQKIFSHEGNTYFHNDQDQNHNLKYENLVLFVKDKQSTLKIQKIENNANENQENIIPSFLKFNHEKIIENTNIDQKQEQKKIRSYMMNEMKNTRDLQRDLSYQIRSLDELFQKYDLTVNGIGKLDFKNLQTLNYMIQENIKIISYIQSKIHSSQSRRFSLLLSSNSCLKIPLIGEAQKIININQQNSNNQSLPFSKVNNNTNMTQYEINQIIQNGKGKNLISCPGPAYLHEKNLTLSQQSHKETAARNSYNKTFNQINLNQLICNPLQHCFDTQLKESNLIQQNSIEGKKIIELQKPVSSFPHFSRTFQIQESFQFFKKEIEDQQSTQDKFNHQKQKRKRQYDTRNVIQNMFSLLIKYLLRVEIDEGAEFRDYLKQYSKGKNKNIKFLRCVLRNYPIINQIEEISDTNKDLIQIFSFYSSKLPLISQVKKINYFNSLIRIHSTQFIVLHLPQIIHQNKHFIQKASLEQFSQNLLSYIQNPNIFLRIKC